MEKVRPWCGQPSDRGRLKNRTEQNSTRNKSKLHNGPLSTTTRVNQYQNTLIIIQSVTHCLCASAINFLHFLRSIAGALHNCWLQEIKLLQERLHISGRMQWPLATIINKKSTQHWYDSTSAVCNNFVSDTDYEMYKHFYAQEAQLLPRDHAMRRVN